MRNLLLAVGAAIAVLSFSSFTGCVTNSNGVKVLDTNTVASVTPLIKVSTYLLVTYSYTKNPAAVKYASAVQTALKEFALSGDLNPIALEAKLKSLPINELKTDEAELIIIPVIGLYKAYGEPYVQGKLNEQVGWKMIIQALVDGIGDSLIGKSL